MERMPTESQMYTEIQLLKKDNEQLKQIFTKLDVSVEKIAEAATNISKILALHEQRVEIMSEDIQYFRQLHDSYLKELKQIQTDCNEKSEKLHTKIDDVDGRIDDLEKYRWTIYGGLIVVTFLISNFSSLITFFSK